MPEDISSLRPVVRELAKMFVDEVRSLLSVESTTNIDVLTPIQVAKEIRRSPATVRGWCTAGLIGRDVRQLNSHRPQWAITRSELAQFLQAGTGKRTERPARKARRRSEPEVIEFFS